MPSSGLARLPSPRIFKTHLPRRWLPATGRFVGLVRDPADVALSYFRLIASTLPPIIATVMSSMVWRLAW